MSEPAFSGRILRRFVETVAAELGADQLNGVLALSELPPEWGQPDRLRDLDPAEPARIYAALQAALRTYYGRGARGVLLRVGQRLWDHLLDDAALGGKARAALIRRLPRSARRKPILELLGRMIASRPEAVTIHTLDLDLLLVDQASPAASGFADGAPICFVTQGLIRESLFWATGQPYDVEEVSCKAAGRNACEFKITLGG